jgi:hypothetical protein
VIRLFFVFLLLASAVRSADIIAAERLYDWTPHVNIGVPGGIPTNRTMYCDVTVSIPGWGGALVETDVWPFPKGSMHAALDHAMSTCPADQYVYIPAGDYYVNTAFGGTADNMTLRGAGMGQTRIYVDVANGRALTIGESSPAPPGRIASYPSGDQTNIFPITAGATRNSNQVTISSGIGTFTVGKFARVDVTNQPTSVIFLNQAIRQANQPIMSYLVYVTAVTVTSGAAGTVDFVPKLPKDVSALSPVLLPYTHNVRTRVGIEDITFDLSQATTDPTSEAVRMWHVYACWLKNIEVVTSVRGQVLFNHAVRCEIRGSSFHGYNTAGGPGSEGVRLQSDCVAFLIEDNAVVDGGFPGICLSDPLFSCWGNVIAYNYCKDVQASGPVGTTTVWGADIGLGHGGHNSFNLVEGNIAGGIHMGDGYYGSTSDNTALRNWFHLRHTDFHTGVEVTQGMDAVDIGHYGLRMNVVGNVLADNTWFNAGSHRYDAPYDLPNYDSGGSNGAKVIYKLGLPYIGGTNYTQAANIAVTATPDYTTEPWTIADGGFGADLNVEATLIRHGNYDYHNTSQMWDAAIANQVIPTSYFRDSKPDWFGTIAWPPVDPSNPQGEATLAKMATMLPAAYRYINGNSNYLNSGNPRHTGRKSRGQILRRR